MTAIHHDSSSDYFRVLWNMHTLHLNVDSLQQSCIVVLDHCCASITCGLFINIIYEVHVYSVICCLLSACYYVSHPAKQQIIPGIIPYLFILPSVVVCCRPIKLRVYFRRHPTYSFSGGSGQTLQPASHGRTSKHILHSTCRAFLDDIDREKGSNHPSPSSIFSVDLFVC